MKLYLQMVAAMLTVYVVVHALHPISSRFILWISR